MATATKRDEYDHKLHSIELNEAYVYDMVLDVVLVPQQFHHPKWLAFDQQVLLTQTFQIMHFPIIKPPNGD